MRSTLETIRDFTGGDLTSLKNIPHQMHKPLSETSTKSPVVNSIARDVRIGVILVVAITIISSIIKNVRSKTREP
jgi:hypothetical protein